MMIMGFNRARVQVLSPSNDNTILDSSPFGKWNEPTRVKMRNCYAFACDAFEPEASQLGFRYVLINVPDPGVTGGKPNLDLGVDSLREGIVADGFVYCPQKEQKQIDIPSDSYLIACYCKPGEDYHFYRYHQPTGLWFHKQGWLDKVSSCDKHKAPIIDVQEAYHGKYKDFIGYFLSPPQRKPMNIMIENMNGQMLYGESPKLPVSFNNRPPSLKAGINDFASFD